jgi:hypothetical protein
MNYQEHRLKDWEYKGIQSKKRFLKKIQERAKPIQEEIREGIKN